MDYDDSLLLAMPKQSTGTVISSTFFVWYGKVTTRFKSSHNAGVVSASILFSNVQDEIDVEFIGSALDQPQSNFYFEGVLNYTNEVNMSSSDTFENWHSYEVDWKEDNITWSIDGEVQRILNKEDTYNETTKIYQFPQTPSRIQLSLWAGGDKGNAVGVVEWAGGDIDWNATDFTNPGYLYASLDYVAVECYDPPSGTEERGNLSYIYTNTKKFTQDTVMITDNDTVIANFGQTGFDISDDDDDDAANSTDSQLAHTSESQSSSSGLPSGYSTQFFQDINTAASSSNAAAPGCYYSLGTFFLFAFYLI
ncbi:DEKNAAC103709 [Brettanomyces naardenensis]|uniref:DEKNAAC103709 n=1 Tax=Brettanomyces naardenensis TaxID=13370 RepID=A0A448YNI6_BRENA|nr:DEKNAAC103709 [Brettanomyces naardenensis]